ncbi:MAG: extracellular solute-binding protein [Sphaerochaetaceae bacterium]
MRKTTLLVLMVLCVTSALFANGTKETEVQQPVSTSSTFTGYPMEKDTPVSFWIKPGSSVTANFSSMGDTPFYKEALKRTGIDIDFQHPPIGQENEQFSLIMADGNYPDIMMYNWLSNYPGGPAKAIADGVIMSLNDIFDKYCPNIKAYLAAHPDYDKAIKTDDGQYYCVPMINTEGTGTFLGPMIRSDILAHLGKEVPTTIDEWYDVLKAAQASGISHPLASEFSQIDIRNWNPFMYAYKTDSSFFVADDNTIHYGPIEEGYKEYLENFAKWYREGLVDPDLPSLTTDQVTEKMTSGKSIAAWALVGGRMGSWIPAGQKTNPDYMLIATPWPTLGKGETPEYGWSAMPFSGNGAAITTKCKNVERAARLLDYFWSNEGHDFAYFGTKDVTYTIDADGNYHYTDLITKNTKGWTLGQMIAAYTIANYTTPTYADIRYSKEYASLPSQKEAYDIWRTNCLKHLLPPITPSPDDSKTLARIMNEITTYQRELSLKFILGTEDIDKSWDTYVANIKKMGIDQALAIENKAYDSYQNR